MWFLVNQKQTTCYPFFDNIHHQSAMTILTEYYLLVLVPCITQYCILYSFFMFILILVFNFKFLIVSLLQISLALISLIFGRFIRFLSSHEPLNNIESPCLSSFYIFHKSNEFLEAFVL